MQNNLKFAKDTSFLNLIYESYVVLAVNIQQQSLNYVGYIIRYCNSFHVYFHILNFLHGRQ
jgi:hypothetical protein